MVQYSAMNKVIFSETANMRYFTLCWILSIFCGILNIHNILEKGTISGRLKRGEATQLGPL
jgi:hypothetical protein